MKILFTFLTEKKNLFWTNKKFVYLIFINKLSWYHPKIMYENIVQKDLNKFFINWKKNLARVQILTASPRLETNFHKTFVTPAWHREKWEWCNCREQEKTRNLQKYPEFPENCSSTRVHQNPPNWTGRCLLWTATLTTQWSPTIIWWKIQ